MADHTGIWHTIGTIHSSHTRAKGTPIQPKFAEHCAGTVELHQEYAEAMRDLDGFDRVWLIYQFDRASETKLTVTPYLDDRTHGLFATRAPARPNPIGISSVRLVRVDGLTLHVDQLDVLDGTPLLDIKPYVPDFDSFPTARSGWFVDKGAKSSSGTADARFEQS